ncbi:hypothetical protein [Acidianus brierleyi]|uniref:Right handed beta helix domain-containing protein n=1 Tax=Acidianus brierleyi TaxID=41673 RepID=A0A2U9ID49_9CREN|nr:hypothetical protein [Acidianus brierleyi]AWR93947.1 hypothetical protein DFR85_04250 [Acidianus brierleyi]
MAFVISDHMDPDVDFYVPPGSDATQAIQQALELSKIYGVAHIIIRGRLYVYATTNVPFPLEQSLNYVFEGDGLGEIIYLQTDKSISPPSMITTAGTANAEMQQGISTHNSVISLPMLEYSMAGWYIAFKNLKLDNYTNQRWAIANGYSNYHSIVMYFDGVEFNINIWINETTEVLVINCYATGELLFDSRSRDVMVIGSRFENEGGFAVSSRGWTVVGCVFVGPHAFLNPGNDGNDGMVVGCVFDSGTIVTQGASGLRVVACTLHNVTFPGGYYGSMNYTYGQNFALIGCVISNYTIALNQLTGRGSYLIAFNTFNPSSDLIIAVADNAVVQSILIIGNTFSSIETHNSFIFIGGTNAPGSSETQLTGKVLMLYIAFNTFNNPNQTPGATYGAHFGSYYIHGIAYVNIGITVTYAYIVFNYFENTYGLYDNSTRKPVGYFQFVQLNSNVQLIQYLNFYFNVVENNIPIYIPSNQTYNAQFNVGIANSTA